MQTNGNKLVSAEFSAVFHNETMEIKSFNKVHNNAYIKLLGKD